MIFLSTRHLAMDILIQNPSYFKFLQKSYQIAHEAHKNRFFNFIRKPSLRFLLPHVTHFLTPNQFR
jgi:hypothetical protein